MDRFTAWVSTHQTLVTGIDIVICILVAILLVFAVRSIIRAWQRMLAAQRESEEKQREEKMEDHRTRSLIRMCEEWCIDASQLKLAWRKEKALKRLAAYMDWLMFLAIAPFIALMVVWVIIYPIFGDTMLVNTFVDISGIAAILWLVYNGIRVLQLHRLFKKVKAIQIKD